MSWYGTSFIQLVLVDGTYKYFNPDYVYKVEPLTEYTCRVYIDTTEHYDVKGSAGRIVSALST